MQCIAKEKYFLYIVDRWLRRSKNPLKINSKLKQLTGVCILSLFIYWTYIVHSSCSLSLKCRYEWKRKTSRKVVIVLQIFLLCYDIMCGGQISVQRLFGGGTIMLFCVG